ncbi:hypothetical protein LTR16_011035, partial [Cryomyces antarcticus]
QRDHARGPRDDRRARAAARGPRSAHPHDREAPLRGEAADGDAGRGARRPRDVEQQSQGRHGDMEAQVHLLRERDRRAAQGAEPQPVQCAGRRGRAQCPHAGGARASGAGGAHGCARWGQEQEEEERAELLL